MAGKVQKNEVRMIGVMPSYGADPIPVGKRPDGASVLALYGVADNSTTSIYTIPAGQTGYLTHYTFSIYNTAAGAGGGRLYINNDTPALWNEIVRMIVPTNNGFAMSGSFNPPLELGAGFAALVQSWIANTKVTVFIHGYRW